MPDISLSIPRFQYNLIRTKYLFADFAHLGSFIVSGDWQFSQYGTLKWFLFLQVHCLKEFLLLVSGRLHAQYFPGGGVDT